MACSTNTKQTYPTLLLQQIARNTCAIANSQAGDVNSVTGTANQITASPTTGAVGLSLAGPHAFSTLTANGILVGNGTSPISAPGATLTATAMALGTAYTSGFQLYNTADQTTNYERLEALWSSNVATIRTTQGGAGVVRTLRLASAGVSLMELVSNGNIAFTGTATGVAGAIKFAVTGVGSNALSGNNVALSLTPTYNQASGTAANTDLLINRTETAVGSGAQYLIQAQVGGVDRHLFLSNGNVGFSGNLRIGNPSVASNAKFRISGNLSLGAWGTAGIVQNIESGNYTDTSTAASGTAATAVFSSFARPTLAATNTNVTTSDAATLYIANSPLAGTNQTITRSWSFWVDDGAVRLDGALVATPQILVGAGAVNLTTISTHYSSTGDAQGLTLAAGIEGQIKNIIHVDDGGSGVLTATGSVGFSAITFNNAGDSVMLQFTSLGWAIIGINGAVITP